MTGSSAPRESLARDQLANERTFLAWVRTGLAFVGLGVVLERIDPHHPQGTWLGAALILIGTALLLYGFGRFRAVTTLLSRGEFRAARRGPFILLLLCLLLSVAALVTLAG